MTYFSKEIQYIVEYDFVETPYGKRNNFIKFGFKTGKEAMMWAEQNTKDGVVVQMNPFRK